MFSYMANKIESLKGAVTNRRRITARLLDDDEVEQLEAEHADDAETETNPPAARPTGPKEGTT